MFVQNLVHEAIVASMNLNFSTYKCSSRSTAVCLPSYFYGQVTNLDSVLTQV